VSWNSTQSIELISTWTGKYEFVTNLRLFNYKALLAAGILVTSNHELEGINSRRKELCEKDSNGQTNIKLNPLS
jgi:hypothetical protein